MSRKHYIELAKAMGDGLAISYLAGGETARTEFYNEVYTPLVLVCKRDNSSFDMTRFSWAAGQAEQAYLDGAKEAGRS
jgi:hypothetical protein